MIVKNISAIQYFLERFDLIDYPKEYVVDYHARAPQKMFFTIYYPGNVTVLTSVYLN